MSGKYSGLHKKIQDVARHAYYVHCASHNYNLNLLLKVAMQLRSVNFTTPLSRYIVFFGHSIERWQKLQIVHDCSCSNPTLKALNPSRWSGRYDAIYALKEKFCDVMKCLTHIMLTSTRPKERDEAMVIKK